MPRTQLLVGVCTALMLALLGIAAAASSSECSFCRYAAWNCTTVTTDAGVETLVKDSAATSSELRKEATLQQEQQSVQVCNAEGKIQVDDVFCDADECTCADDRQCASLVLGCRNIFQARSRKRCIGDAAVQQRFHKCAVAQALTEQTRASLEVDWVMFKDAKRCKSADCLAVRRFHQCGAVQCGYLVIAWKEDTSGEYRFIVDGSRSSDMAAGTFLFKANMASRMACGSISSTKIRECYGLQTRNQRNGTCDGIYLQVDTQLQAKGEKNEFSRLSWPVWFTVVGSVSAALASIASVGVMYARLRRVRQEEASGLLANDIACEDSDCKTPQVDINGLQDAKSPRFSTRSALTTREDLRQRGASGSGPDES